MGAFVMEGLKINWTSASHSPQYQKILLFPQAKRIVVVAHAMLIIAFRILKTGNGYHELSGDQSTRTGPNGIS
jgi:hypothetical protein